MIILIHRGSKEIGGSCVEIASKNTRILIDAGMPLKRSEEHPEEVVPRSLRESLNKSDPPFAGILISHAHLDHYGLIPQLPGNIPVYSGSATASLMNLSLSLSKDAPSWREPSYFENKKSFTVGDFTITPYLVDHSGFDSYAFLIEADQKRIFYSGDFRDHGPKKYLVRDMMKNPPSDIDILLLEGTTIGRESSKAVESEKDLIEEFLRVFSSTKGPAFVTMAGQNIDRFVTVFKAARKAKRLVVIDPYVAEVLDLARKAAKLAGKDSRLPHPTWKEIKVCCPRRLREWLEKLGGQEIVERHKRPNGVTWEYLSRNQSRIVMIAKTSAMEEIFSPKVKFDLSRASWIYSLWKGYLKPGSDLQKMEAKFKEKGTYIEHLHTSGHAAVSTLKKFVHALKPRKVIPVHTEQPAAYKDLMPNVIAIEDGVPVSI